MCLSLDAAGAATQAREVEHGEGLATADGDEADGAGDTSSVPDDVSGVARGALRVWVAYMEVGFGAFVDGFDVLVAGGQAEGTGKERDGQGGLLS